MALTKIKLGNLITEYNKKNTKDIDYPFFGINIDKNFMPSVTSTDSVDRSKYKIVKKGVFVFSGMQTGRDCCIRIGLYEKNDIILVSPAYTTFTVTSPLIIPEYLFMLFSSSEKDRYGAFLSDGSIRSNLDWDVFCNIELEIPDLPTQQKYVDIYNAMIANQKAYEKGLDDLKLVCDAYIEDLRRKIPCEEIGSYIIEVSKKNKDLDILTVQGVDSTSRFVGTKANLQGVDLTKYKIVEEGFFVYNPSRINLGSIALKTHGNCIVSPMYEIFKINDTNKLLPEYLFTWLTRAEFLRSTLFYAIGSVRDTFDLELMKQVSIPIPKIETQRSIVNIYKCYTERKDINERLKNQIKDICPILIKGAIEEGKQQ